MDALVKSNMKNDSDETNCILFLPQRYNSKTIAKDIKDVADKVERLKNSFDQYLEANFLWELQPLHDKIIRLKEKMAEEHPCFNDLVIHAFNIGCITEPEKSKLLSEKAALLRELERHKHQEAELAKKNKEINRSVIGLKMRLS